MNRGPSSPRSAVALLQTGPAGSEHERQVQSHLAGCIGRLLNLPVAGVRYGERAAPELYLIPDATLIAPQPGIRSEDDLYGGVVSQPFMATKAISHPLVDSHAAAPVGWSEAFMALAGNTVLPGYSAFDHDDALRAGHKLLANGAIRGKRVQAKAGRGQQRLTIANDGACVYGGSDLQVVRGDYHCLLQQLATPLAQAAVRKAQHYERAAETSFPGFIASRRNCDVATGLLPSGQHCLGVLEQSWRIGGASSAEIHALLAFADNPLLQRICASSWEVYGQQPQTPDGGQTLYQGDDPDTGPITKGVTLAPWLPPANP